MKNLSQSGHKNLSTIWGKINFSINKIANLSIELISPAGTTSVIAASAVGSGITRGYDDAWRFGSSKHLGEDPSGTWRLIARNAVGEMMTLRNWKLKIRGYEVQLNAVASDDLSYLKGKTRLQLPLAGAHWKQALSPDNFRLRNAPPGLRIEEVVRATTTHAELILDLSADLADADYLFQVEATTETVSNFSGALLSNDLKIARIAVKEATIPEGRVGSNYHFVASDILSSPMPLSYNITLLDEMQNELQPDEFGFSIEGATLRGTPTRAGRYQMRITATRDDGISREEHFAFAVAPRIVQTQLRVFLEGLLR